MSRTKFAVLSNRDGRCVSTHEALEDAVTSALWWGGPARIEEYDEEGTIRVVRDDDDEAEEGR